MVGDIGMLLAFPVVLFLAAAVAPGLLQTGFLASAESLKPKFEKISPLTGLKRPFSLKSVLEFVKGVMKLAVSAVVATWKQEGHRVGKHVIDRLNIVVRRTIKKQKK